MGLPTKLKVVFSAVNPPETYQTGYMDLAIASRFVSVQVPNIGEMKGTDLDRILSKNGHPPKKSNLKTIIKQAGGCQFKKKDLEKAQAIVKKVAGDLAETEIIFNPRQLKMRVKLLVGGHALGKVTPIQDILKVLLAAKGQDQVLMG